MTCFVLLFSKVIVVKLYKESQTYLISTKQNENFLIITLYRYICLICRVLAYNVLLFNIFFLMLDE